MTRIASQLDEGFNQQLRQSLPGVEVLSLPRGLPSDLPGDIQVLLAAPHADFRDAPEPPAGWPFGLCFVQLVTSGLDYFPRWLFQDLPVASARGSTAESIAEFALAAIFAAAKQLPQVWIERAEHWQQQPLASVAGSTLGLFGFGSIARELAPKAQALGMQVLALRRSAQPFEVPGVQPVADLHQLFARADHLLLAVPLTEHTRRIIDADVLAAAKPGLHLINIARGALIDQPALLQALETGRIGLASLDVADPEPLPAGHAFYRHPRIRLSPHTSANSPRVYLNIARLLGRNLQRWGDGLPLENPVEIQRGY
ncbi:D-isomer specific 2-hydroxyacid dehydrogenase family protein [Pseudomonas sp. TNT2022 ID357]|uniref:D-isomer specific 2-hydroxyacid dehydrogenase family protein n=1 Tax=Pseudomonas idahonensis TaxID=2942628 RepID=A0ABT5PZK0_9PSED|nr:D-isomer specific 2-hydroxyacid dehydrogenase family protein [Pseudomonas idahonensis]MDD1147298.1 D-isomer specific 2-hydroxyacid dehydrogenase family protein [Pseudomonas idahonensis]